MRIEPTTVAGVPVERHLRNGAGTELTDTATILYFHGGGYLAGSPATHRRFVANLTWAIGGSAVVPDYRLAPEHPFPAAVDDAVAVYRALLAAGTDPSRIVIAGDSAGGGLSLAALLRLRDEGDQLPAGAIVFSPYTDLEHTANSIYRNVATDYLPFMHPIRPLHEYLGEHDPKDPYASPMYGDYRGIPPLLVFAGGREMILDDSVRLARRAQSAGCEATLHVAADMYHVWPALLPNHAETLKLLAMCREWVTAHT
jgi:acetyl esterase/lipase